MDYGFYGWSTLRIPCGCLLCINLIILYLSNPVDSFLPICSKLIGFVFWNFILLDVNLKFPYCTSWGWWSKFLELKIYVIFYGLCFLTDILVIKGFIGLKPILEAFLLSFVVLKK